MANASGPETSGGREPLAAAAAPQVLPTAAGFVAKARDLDALRNAVIDAAGVGAGLWFSYLFVLLYLLIAVGSVTHRDLLYASPIRLPFLAVDLPLVGFFVLGPLLFLIVHAYVLLHLVLLAGKVGAFHTELEMQIADDDTRARLRRQLPSNIFVQLLAGPREVRTGIVGIMLRLIAQISLVAGPLGLVVFFQLQFLPYHHESVTWWHRFAVLADLTLLWMLWPSVARGKATWIAWRDFRTRKVAALALASLVPLLLVFTIATFPSEWLDARLPSVRFIPSQWPSAKLARANNDPRMQGAKGKGGAPSLVGLIQSMGWTSLHELLVGGDINRVVRKPTSLWSNRLVLPEIDLVDRAKFDTEEKIKAAAETFALRGRRLEGAILIGARLRKADLAGAQLQGAFLSLADLRDAKLGCGIFGDICANLQGAELIEAKLQGMDLGRAQLQGAELREAQLQGANLSSASLQGANLSRAQLQGADLVATDLQGAHLVGAQLQGANLERAYLQGADLSDSDLGDTPRAGLQGARLAHASLQGATLRGTRLQGADLTGALLQGADFTSAGLEGTNLKGARLRGALLDQVFVWRTDPLTMMAESARIINPNRNQQPSALGFDDLKRLIEEQVPKGERRDAALKRIAILDPANSDEKNDAEIFDEWDRLAKSSPSVSEYETVLAEILQKIGCDARSGSYVIREWHPQFDPRFSPQSPHAARVADIFLDETRCPGARGLSEWDKDLLKSDRAALTSTSAHPLPNR